MSSETLFIVKYAHADSAPMSITDLIDQVKYAGLHLNTPAKESFSKEWSTVEAFIPEGAISNPIHSDSQMEASLDNGNSLKATSSSNPVDTGSYIKYCASSHETKKERALSKGLDNEETSLFESSAEWRNYMRELWPWELQRVCLKLLGRNDPLWMDVHFQIGCLRCFIEHGGFNQLIDEKCHSFCFEIAERHLGVIRALGGDIEEAYQADLAYARRWGWPTAHLDVLGETEITKLMRFKTSESL